MENVLKRGDCKMKIGRFIFLEFCWAVCILHTTSDIHDIQSSFLSCLIVVKICMMRWLACCVHPNYQVLIFPMMDTAEEIKQLLSIETFISYENCAYLGGACNVGKSTLASILIDQEIPQI